MPTEVLLKPLLTSLQAVAVRDFLEAVRKYHRHNARYGLPPVDLDALIAPALLPAIKGWAETQGIDIPHDPGEGSAAGTGAGAGASASASHGAGKEETKSADFPAHPQAAAGTSALQRLWATGGSRRDDDSHLTEFQLLAILQQVADKALSFESLSKDDVVKLMNKHMTWEQDAASFGDAFSNFYASFHATVHAHRLEDRLIGTKPAEKLAVRTLMHLLQPPVWRAMVEEKVEREEIKELKPFWKALTSFEQAYEVLQRDRRARAAASAPQVQLKALSSTSGPARGGRPSSGAGKSRFKPRPTATSSVPSPQAVVTSHVDCLRCHRDHYIRDCPVATPAERERLLAKYKADKAKSRSESRHQLKMLTIDGRSGTADPSLEIAAVSTGPGGSETVTTLHFPGVDRAFRCLLDSGATTNFIPPAIAAMLPPDCKRIAYSKPRRVQTADAARTLSATGRVEWEAYIGAPGVPLRRMGCLSFEVTEGVGDEVYIGVPTLRRVFGIDLQTQCIDRMKAGPLGLGTPDSDEVAATLCRIAAQQEEEDMLPLPIAQHDPRKVKAALDAKVQEAITEGLAPSAAERLRIALHGELGDVFRLVKACDGPAKVTPVVVEMQPGKVPKHMPQRRYTAEQSAYLRLVVREFERGGELERTGDSAFVSPCHVVQKDGVTPDTPLQDKYRLTVDVRAVNDVTIPTHFPVPTEDYVRSKVAGRTHFGKTDCLGGFWQLPLSEDSQKYFNISTDFGVFKSRRVLQGAVNSTSNFQASMTEVLVEELDKDQALVFVDDVLAMGDSDEELVDSWLAILRSLQRANVKLSVRKTQFYKRELLFCGKILSAAGLKPNPEFVHSLLLMPKPATVAELRVYLALCNWLRGSVPRYSALVEPLQQLQTAGLAMTEAPKRQAQARKVSVEAAGWTSEHDDCFRQVNAALANAVTLAHQNPAMVTCIFSDASSTAWAGIVTQCWESELGKPVLQQQHQPLAFVSGTFNTAERNYPTVEQEAFAIKTTATKCRSVLQQATSVHIFTDHKNLTSLFNPHVALAANRQQAADRIQRWQLIMSQFRYEIHYVKGEDNVFADLLTRWGSLEPPASASPTGGRAAVPMTVPLLRAVRTSQARTAAVSTSTSSTPTSTTVSSVTPARRAISTSTSVSATVSTPAATPTPSPTTSTPPVIQLAQDALALTDVPALHEILTAQGNDPDKGLLGKYVRGVDGLLRLDSTTGPIYVPDTNRLRQRICVVAHSGSAGHRGSEVTTNRVKALFTWPHLEESVRAFCRSCLVCLKTKGGATVPRPLLRGYRASKPNESISFDFYFVRAAEPDTPGQHQYVLILLDSFSNFVELVPASAANAETVVQALLDWFKRFGVVHRWTSDRATHFFNHVLARMKELLAVEHHFTTAYASWANGKVERVCKELKQLLSALMLAARMQPQHWPLILPVANSVLNHTPSRVLGGHAPVTVFTGLRPDNPLSVMFDPVTVTLAELPVTAAEADRAVEALRVQLHDVHDRVQTAADSRPLPTRAGEQQVDFVPGDYVLTSTAHVTAPDKTAPKWAGPAQVVAKLADLVYVVKDVCTGVEREVHARHLKSYHDSSLVVTADIVAAAAHGARYTVDRVLGHKRLGRAWFLTVLWQLGDQTDEPFARVLEDVPMVVRAYVHGLPEGLERDQLIGLLGTPVARRGRKARA